MSSDDDATIDSTQNDSRKLLAGIYERGQARKRLKDIGVPQVGIFWVVDGNPLAFGDSLNDAEQWGGVQELQRGPHRVVEVSSA
jgi:hypothetical protein